MSSPFAGKLWLASLAPKEVSRVLGRRLPAVAPKTLTSVAALRQELERIRAAMPTPKLFGNRPRS